MKESLKEKRIRFVLIGFFVFLVICGFLYRFEMRETRDNDYSPLALVLKKSADMNDNPNIVLYEYKNSKHILAAYEIERMNRYKFNTLHVIELEEAPEQISPDRTAEGIWVKANRKWTYYSQSLHEEDRPPENRITDSSSGTPYSYDDKKAILTINNNHSIVLEKGEKPTGLLSLSYDGSVWLVITERNIKIAAIDTK
ncbi:hypothetical protein ACFFHH_11175 [Cytobacillus solani]|uniref:Uncharacterized protein n=1 Tax=Cytobacillus solani TaxID=1637975 RepID=A0A0Q3VIT7_9BACI|nr:hypothetical protein [Cytobacillus solani]KOP83753.1 hypothetical protein AMS60_15385 [Bacillus sp. FJAT-21945]KQL20831.1 hypothetical protein AN957_21010 [Cytobacillus solani]